MKKIFLGSGLIFALNFACLAQQTSGQVTSAVNGTTSVGDNSKNANLASGTMISGQLQNALDVKKARVGDQVVLKTTRSIKQNGRTTLEKGSRLLGRVTEVQKKTRNNAASQLTVVFDRLQSGSLTAPFNATIISITEARATAATTDDSFDSEVMATSNTRATSNGGGSSGGGLLGGVGGTVNNVLNTTTRTAGTVAGTAVNTAGATTRAVGRTASGIRLTPTANAQIAGSTTLSHSTGNLRLEKGATFFLQVSESAGKQK